MIKIEIKETSNIDDVIVHGHANYSESGTDIVCASVSTLVISTVNAILRFDHDAISYEENDGFINIKNIKKDNITNELLNNMISLFEELVTKYPKNIQLKRGNL